MLPIILNNRVQKFNSSGTFVSSIGSQGSGNGQFNNPYKITFDTADNIYVVDHANSRVQKFDSSATYLTKFGSYGTGDGFFSFPKGIAVDSAGMVYVEDSGNNRIQVIQPTGAPPPPDPFLRNISDTMSESRISQKSNHNIVFQMGTGLSQASTIIVVFPVAFTGSVGFADIDLNFGSSTAFNLSNFVFTAATGTTIGATSAPGRWGVTSSSNIYTFTLPSSATTHFPESNEYVQILFGTNATTGGTGTNQFTNPSSVGFQRISILTSAGDAGVVITNGNEMSGSISSTLQMVVSGVAGGVTVFSGGAGATTDPATTGTTIPWSVMTT
ncbi:MAG: hypothetical protein HZA36_01635, partial [Parcubacteria group bacterium]|nr:hypothetical protein [Parcubacteria group bacterium]